MNARVKWGMAAFGACLAVFAIVVVALVTLMQAYAGNGTYSYVYRWWDSSSNTVGQGTGSQYCRDIDEGDDSTLYSGWYITGEDDTDINLVKIAANSEVNIIVKDGTTQLVDGIYVPASSTLNIYGQSGGSGALRCVADNASYAGIGGLDGDDPEDGTSDCGTINIHGGNIYAEGDDHSSLDTEGGAGIGGGYQGSGGTVRIFGGEVEAKGNSDAAGIGGGSHGGGGTVEIYGGKVTTHGGSTASEGGAGIGGGRNGGGGTIRIYSGTVNATGGCDGAGIGGGDHGDGGDIEIHSGTINAAGDNAAGIGGGQFGSGGHIKIYGGNVTATTDDDSAGIGGGETGNGGTIEIYGGTVSAEGHDGAGIGGGNGSSSGGSSGTIKIGGSANITKAKGGSNSAGIGGGYNGACENIEITGGTINATGGSVDNSGGAGIGGGNGHNGGTIIINNANVTAQGGVDAAGIGGGDGVGAGNGRDGGNITIGGTLSNTIKATGGNYAAGIGGGQYGNGGTVTINGGTIEATGGRDGAGIGGGEYGNGGKVTINGGKVTAKGSPGNTSFEGGAGIGGGDGTQGDAYGNGGEVTITGGEVIATGNCDGAGIGGGDQGKGGTVTITGGTVTATGSDYAAGIGGGDADRDIDGTSHGDGGTVTITGNAHVTATGGNSGAGIGSGEEGNTGGTVTIGTQGSSTGPTVIATGGQYAAGIGAGDAYRQGNNQDVSSRGADVTIYSGTVTATGGEDAAGIGGGEGGSNGTTKIYGGTVVAKAGTAADNDGGAGIGSGDDCIREKTANRKNTTGGTIEIHGGDVTATGNADGAGIGGGDYGSGGNITITGGTVTANGGAYAAGIGGGECRGAGSVTITGGYIRATGGSDEDSKYGGAGIGGGANIANRTSEQNNDSTLGGADQGQAIGEDTISISGSATVVANGGANAAGIGGGTAGAPGSVTIDVDESGRVEATGGKHAAGIGGGKGNDGEGEGNRVVNYGVSGKITINSGDVTANGGKNGGAGIGSGAACGEPSMNTVDVTINGGVVAAKAGAMDENSQYDSGVAIGAGGQYLKNELNDVEIDDGFVIEDVDIPAKFKGTIKFNGGHVVAQAATATEDLDDYLKNALNVVGASRSSNVSNGQVEFNGSTVYMWTDGFSDGDAKKYSQAVRATDNMIYFKDDPEHQNVWYVLVPEDGEDFSDEEKRSAGATTFERVYAVTKYDELVDPNNYGLVVVEPQHDHDFTYTNATTVSENDTIVATCSKPTCSITGNTAKLQIKKPLHAKYGDGLEAVATVVDTYGIGLNAEIEYFEANSDGTGPQGNELSEPPTGAGTYWAQVTLGSDGNTATAHVLYTIEKAESPYTVANTAGLIIPEGQTPTYPVFVDLSNNLKYDSSIEDYNPTDGVTYSIEGEPYGCFFGTDDFSSTLFAGNNTQPGNSVTVKVHVPGDSNYKDIDATITVTITKKPTRTVMAGVVDEGVYGQEDPLDVYAVWGKSRSTDICSFEVKDGSEDYIEVVESDESSDESGIGDEGETADGNGRSFAKLKIKKVPSDNKAYVTVTVMDTDMNFAPSYAEIEVVIHKAEVTITAASEAIAVGGTPKGDYEVDGLVGDDQLTALPTLTYKDGAGTEVVPSEAAAGTYAIEASGANAGDNYEITYVPGTLTVKNMQTIIAPAVYTLYGDTDKAVRATVANPATGGGAISYAVKEGSQDYIEVNPTTGALTIKAVPPDRIAKVVATAAPTDTYEETSVDIEVGILPMLLTVKASDLTTYVGETVPDLSNPELDVHYTVNGLRNDDTVDEALPTKPALAYYKGSTPTYPVTTIAGSYDIVPSNAASNPNYVIRYEKGTLTVKDRLKQTVTASNMTVTYGEAGKYIEASTDGDGALSYEVRGSAVTVDASGLVTANRAGTAYVTITAAGTENYAPATTEIRVSVRRAQLTVTAKDEEIYAGDTPEGFYDVSGLIGSDVLTTEPKMTYLKDGVEIDPLSAPAGVYDIVPSGADSDGKYTVSYVNGKLTIRTDQVIAASDMTVTYGDTGKYVKATTNGDGALSYAVKAGSEDFIDVNASTGALTIKRAGVAYVTVTAEETAASAQATKDVKITIGKKKAAIQADNKSQYIADMEELELTATVSGAAGGDTLEYELSCDYSIGGLIAGQYPITVTADASIAPNYNYDITTKGGTLTITETDMTVSASGWSGTYDANPHGITVEVTMSDAVDYTVAYGTTEGTYDSATSPTQTYAGSLTVYYQVSAGSDVVTGSADVVVEKAPISPSVSIEGWRWNETPKEPVLARGSNPGGGAVTYEYAKKGSSNWTNEPPTSYGDYTVMATVAETANYLSGTATADFSVSADECTLTFNLDGGTLDGKTGAITMKARYSETVKLPNAPAKSGYTFKYWSSSEYGAGASYKVEGDRSFTAVWERNADPTPTPGDTDATLTFDLAGGTLNGQSAAVHMGATVGNSVRLLAAPARSGYTFKAWRYSGGGDYAAGAEYKVNGDATFTAVWESQSGQSDQSGSQTSGNVTMYRMYNPYSGEHFYTASLEEVTNIIKAGWHWEGVGWTAPKKSATPVYRLYNVFGGEHHYTTNARERSGLIAAGWLDEGIGWYSNDAKTVPLFREYNPYKPSCNHNYTANYAEHSQLVRIGWRDEGIAWYGV